MSKARDTGIHLALLGGSVVVGLYVLELILMVIGSRPYPSTETPAQGAAGDTRELPQVVQDLRASGVDAYPSIVPRGFLRSDGVTIAREWMYPLGGVSNSVTVFCRRRSDREFLSYTSDERGFNNPPGIWESQVDAVLVGDSFAHGYCVEPGADLASQLRERGLNVLTLGMTANGPLAELAAVREYAQPLRVPLVLWLYYEGNDLENLFDEEESPTLQKYLTTDFSQGLFQRQPLVDETVRGHVERRMREWLEPPPVEQRGTWLPRLWIFAKLGGIRTKLGWVRGDALEWASPEALGAVLAKASKIVESWGGRLVFVYLPDRRRYRDVLVEEDPFSRAAVLSVVRELGLPMIDLHEDLVLEPDQEALFEAERGLHYSRRGYATIAGAIVAGLNPQQNP